MLSSDLVVERVIHEGPDTSVQQAVHTPTGARVIVKQPISTTPSPRIVGRLKHEHKVLTMLESVPGVVRVHSLVQQQHSVALVMKDDGLRSLHAVLSERGRLPLPVGLRFGERLARLLARVHDARVIHKDVNPHNILVDDACEAVTLIDFGISTCLSHETALADVPECLEGTLPYLSPEQTGRMARAIDARTDLYSLGVTLFEALSGRRPFLERDASSLVHAHLAKAPPALDDVAPDVPGGVALIVSRLLSKDPEQRYQTARGVAEDFAQALQALKEHGTVEPFVLGKKDFSPNLSLPQTLIGRQDEIAELSQAFAHAAQGGARLLLIGGPSGIGKTALVRTVYRDMARIGKGVLIDGKHDVLARATPLSAMAEAFGGLLRQWLARPEAELQRLRARIRTEVGDNARLIADVVPELEILMGKLAPVQPVFGNLVVSRQNLTWVNFIRAIVAPNPPLVLFLDDIQWADTATLRILQTVLTDVERRSLLVLATYRDNETPPEHPLWRVVEAVEKSGVNVGNVAVGPLSEPQICQWTAKMLECPETQIEPLAHLLNRKTRGNPFFLEQLVLSLHRQGQLTRDLENGQWRWDFAALERVGVTDNVIELLSMAVQKLPTETQRLLGLAACVGHSFGLDEIARLSGSERGQVAMALAAAVSEELLVPTSGAYRIAEALHELGSGVTDAEYRFLHDRVQQASYERLSAVERTRTHLEIGRRLYSRYRTDGGTAQQLVEIVRHLGLGAEQMESAEERTETAKLHLTAARVTKDAGSYRTMAQLLETAQALLGPAAFLEEPALSVELALERLEAACLLREFDDVEARALALLAMPLPPLPRLVVHEIQTRCCVASGQLARGVKLGLESLAERGITYPDTDEACLAALGSELGELEQWLDEHPDGFGEMPKDQSVEHLLVDALTAHMLVCLGVGRLTPLAPLGIVRSVRETIRRGAMTVVEPLFIGTLAHAISTMTAQYRLAARWIQPAVVAASHVASPLIGECLTYQAIYVVYSRPFDESAPIHERAISAALEFGSSQGASWALLNELLSYRVFRGQPLPVVDDHRKARLPLMQRAGDAHGMLGFELTECYCNVLTDPGNASKLLQPEPLAVGSRALEAEGDGITTAHARVLETQIMLVTGQYARALERAREAEAHRPALMGIPPVTNIPLWLALAAAKCWHDTTNAAERAKLTHEMESGIARLTYLSEGCAENFLHSLRLIEAEVARVQGRTEEAMAKYDEAIALAREQRFLHIEALAAHFCAEFHLDAGRHGIAGYYMSEARQAYARWGARAVLSHLDAKYRSLRMDTRERVSTLPSAATLDETSTFTTGNAALDLHTVVRTSQALSSELHPDRVVGRLMELLLENAGAQRGVLFLNEDSTLTLVARLTVEDARIETGLSEPIERSDVPVSVVQYVARTAEAVVTGDANHDVRFAADPYWVSHSVRSLLGLPLTHRGRLVGVLYLEHRDVPSAFAPARAELLAVIASQAAIAVENAMLYRELEAKVEARTAELRIAKHAADRASQAKSEFLSGMSHELRTPLNSILGYAQILERLPNMPPKAYEGVQIIHKSGEHLLTLVNDVLDLAKIEAGKMELVPKAFDFPSFMHTVAGICRVRAENKNLSFVHEMAGPSLNTVLADEKRLMQVLLNLLGNAIKFTDKGSVRLRATDMGSSSVGRRLVEFQVQDTGSGIAPAHIARIFAPFEQVGDEKARSQGTGLGLAITKKLVEQMGGTLDVQSEVGKGSTFTVALELLEVATETSQTTSLHWQRITGYQGRRRRILVVDDNPDNRAVLRDLLVPVGFDVLEAEEGAAALRIAAEQVPALIVMDLAMPTMDGHEATRILRQMPALRDVVILASSASTSEIQRQQCLRDGCDAFLPKPVEASELFENVKKLLRIEWVLHEPAAATDESASNEVATQPFVVPGAQDIAKLWEFSKAGRVGNVLQEAERLEQVDPKLGPWVAELRALAKSFRIKQLREFLEKYLVGSP